jgi:decaprenylphospho-beta-D-erythro-pentofuranosid-2-ulose 2-reductase
MKKILVIGATSVIAQATIKLLAEDGAEFYLVGRNIDKLNIMATDLKVRGITRVDCYAMDVTAIEAHAEMLSKAINFLGGLDLAFIAHGTLPDQSACQLSVTKTITETNINFTSTIALLTLLAKYFEQKQSGHIAVISSIAGDRGRQSNYTYGAAKAGVSVFLQGLSNRLYKQGICVLDIKPGFVDTPMIARFKRNFLWAKPEYVAKKIVRAIKNKKQVLYVPWFWFFIMLIIKLVPKFIFNRLAL